MRQRLRRIAGFTAAFVLGSLAVTILGVWAQAAVFRVSTDCTAMSPAPPTGSVCLQLGIPPKLYYYTGTAWAHVGFEDTTGTTVVLDTLNEVAWVALAGQQGAVVTIPASVTLTSSTLTPVVSVTDTSAGAWLAIDHLDQPAAWFTDATGQTLLTLDFPLATPANAVALGINTFLPAKYLGVKVTAYTSGTASTTVLATAQKAVQGTAGHGRLLPTVESFASSNTLNVMLKHAVAAWLYPREASGLIDSTDVGDIVAIAGSGGQVTFNIPSGGTGTVALEGQIGGGDWFTADTTFQAGGVSTFPARGYFNYSGYSNYRIRPTAWSAGSATAVLVAASGAAVPPGLSPTESFGMLTATTTNAAATCHRITTASTNSINCKASAGNVYGIRAINTTATLGYLRTYNLSSAPTCSSATGWVESIPIPASATGAGVTIAQPAQAYATGIGFCITGGGASTDNTNAPAGIYASVLFK